MTPTTSTLSLATPDGPMPTFEAVARRRAPGGRRGHPGGLRGHWAHRGRSPGGWPTRGGCRCPGPLPPPGISGPRLRRLRQVMPVMSALSAGGSPPTSPPPSTISRAAGSAPDRTGIVGLLHGRDGGLLRRHPAADRRRRHLLRRRGHPGPLRPSLSGRAGPLVAGPLARPLRRPRPGHPGRRRRSPARGGGQGAGRDRGRALCRRRATGSTATTGRRTTRPRPDAWHRTLDWFDRHLAS